MKILLITDEVWNDQIHGNNVLSNWFDGINEKYNVEIANIYCSPDLPLNNCCKKYFQITDTMMVKSILNRKKAGCALLFDNYPTAKMAIPLYSELENKRLYDILKTITGETVRSIREMIWSIGRYNIDEMYKFIDEFSPDIIFSPRMGTLKILRLEKIVYEHTKKPIVAFTGDNEYSCRCFNISPIFWIRRFIFRKKFQKMMPNYSLYYTLSSEQKDEYEKEFRCNIKVLHKCGNFCKDIEEKPTNNPIKMIYAGKLYCNRWKCLAAIGEALKKINSNKLKMQLDIYTTDKVSRRQREALDNGKDTFLKGAVTPHELKKIYKDADIALHVESFDLINRLLTRVSFSTKIIDCLASGCAVMAICWNKHSGYTYLKREDAAICIDNLDKIESVLEKICNNTNIVAEYAQKARECGIRHHRREDIQSMLISDFNLFIK